MQTQMGAFSYEGPPDKRNAAPIGDRDGANSKAKNRAGSENQKYADPAAPSIGKAPGQRKNPTLWDDVKRRFRDETSFQRLEHHEIACRYAWDDRDNPNRRRPKLWLKVRLRELERLYGHRWGGTLPDDDGGRDDLLVAAHHVAQCGNPDVHIPAWARIWAPWLSDDDCTALIETVVQKPLRWGADKLAWRMRLTLAERTYLKITTIGAIDANKAERAKLAKQRKAAGELARRRKAGAGSRAEYEAASAARAKPWEALGISRRTWYSRGKPQPPERAAEPICTSPCGADKGVVQARSCATGHGADGGPSRYAPQQATPCRQGTRPRRAPARAAACKVAAAWGWS